MADKADKVTITKAELAGAIADAVALAMAAQPAKKAKGKTSDISTYWGSGWGVLGLLRTLPN